MNEGAVRPGKNSIKIEEISLDKLARGPATLAISMRRREYALAAHAHAWTQSNLAHCYRTRKIEPRAINSWR
jgi:hypothetical protein